MQWKAITTNLGQTAYSLWNNGRKLLTLAYKSQTDWVHVEAEDGERRYFKYRKKGLLKHKVVLENEYGTDLGELKREGDRQYIIIDNKHYYLNFLNNKEVAIVEENTEKPLSVCSLDVEASTPKAKDGLLMVLCYYLLGHPQKHEEFTLA